MIDKLLKHALRSLGKYKMYTLVNLIGLTLGLTASLVIFLYVIDELAYDRHHDSADNLYQLIGERTVPGQDAIRSAGLPAPLTPELYESFAEIQNAFRLIVLGRADLTWEENGYYEVVYAADPQIFEMLDYEFIQGDPGTAFLDPNSVVLTQSTARKYFGDEDPIGKVLTGTRGQNIVSAVIEDPPANSHLRFNALFPFPPYMDLFFTGWQTDWSGNSYITYLELAADVDPVTLQQQITSHVRNETPFVDASVFNFSLLPLTDIHFLSNEIQGQVNVSPGSFSTLYTLEAIALFLVLIACINYTNLATARSINRAHEISLRKLMGAGRAELMGQFLLEALALTLLAFLLATTVAQMILPAINGLVSKQLSLSTLLQPAYLIVMTALVALVGLAAGAYPALVLSNRNIADGLKDSQQATSRASSMRKLLVVTQFTLSIVLVFCTLAVFKQMAYIQNKPLGFDRQNVIAVDINSGAVRGAAQAIRDGFLAHPDVLSASTSSRLPGDWKPAAATVQATLPGQDSSDTRTLDLFVADQNFLQTFGVTLQSGRNFAASDTGNGVLVNRTLVELMGWEQPLGQQLNLLSSSNPTVPATSLETTVVGVVEDFNYQSLHQVIGPVVIQNGSAGATTLLPHDYLSVRISGNDIPGTLNHLRSVINTHDAITPFEYNFVEAQMRDNFYSNDRMTATLFSFAAGMAIFIACMGLFGLTAFTTEQRSKEIGIRKVLGATIANIVELLSADFMKLVLVAIVLALPTGWYLINLWLENFAYSAGVGLDIFVASSLMALVVSLGTVSIQSVKAAMRNPIESISYE